MHQTSLIILYFLFCVLSLNIQRVCQQGSYWNRIQKLCVMCQKGCLQCDQKICLKYSDQLEQGNVQNRILFTDFIILGCSSECSNCIGSTCSACIDGYALNGGGNCIPCHSSCLTCTSPNSVSACSSCIPTQYLDASDHCIDCSSAFSSRCYLCDDVGCNVCMPGYFPVTGSPHCDSCASVCITCNSSSNCLECAQYYQPINGTCTDLCGDFHVITLPCDNAKGVPFDGCDDDCQPMPDFSCTNTSFTSLCSYNGSVTMTQVSLQRNSYDNILETQNNTLELVVKIEPNLHALSNTNLYEIFFLNVSSLYIQKLQYADGLLKVIIYYNTTITGQQFQLQYKPSYSSDERLSSSQQSVLNTAVVSDPNPIHYSKTSIQAAKAMFYISIIVIVLGWLAFFFAIPFYRLAGLQAMFVLQIGWVLLASLPDPLPLSIYTSYPLKYSSGYAIQEQISGRTQLTLQHKTFKLDINSIQNNINILLILYIVPVVGAILFKILSHTQKFKEGAVSKKQFCIQMIMYAVMVNFVAFVFFSFLFFSSAQDKIHLLSLIIFTIAALTTVVTFVMFFFSPDPFNRFRYSFKIGCLSFNHYYLHTLNLLSIIILIFVCITAPWAPCIPLTILIIYTLLYRPYLTLQQNLRSSFFLLIILLTAVFRTVFYLTETEWKLSEFCCTIFFIIVGLLYPAAIIWAFVDVILAILNKKTPIAQREKKSLEYEFFEQFKQMKQIFSPEKMYFLQGNHSPLKIVPQTMTNRYQYQSRKKSEVDKNEQQERKTQKNDQKNDNTFDVSKDNILVNDILGQENPIAEDKKQQYQQQSYEVQDSELKAACLFKPMEKTETKPAFKIGWEEPIFPQIFKQRIGDMEMKNIFAEQTSKDAEAEDSNKNNEVNTKIQKFDNLDDSQKLKMYRALKKEIQFINMVNAEQLSKPKDEKLIQAYTQI